MRANDAKAFVRGEKSEARTCSSFAMFASCKFMLFLCLLGCYCSVDGYGNVLSDSCPREACYPEGAFL